MGAHMIGNVRTWLVACALTVSSAAFAESVTATVGPRHLVDINPLSLANGKLSLEYEGALSNSASIVVGPQMILYRDPIAGSGPAVFGYGLSLGVHFFPGAEALHGFWLGPEVNGGYLGSGDKAGLYMQLNGILGYTFLPTDHFAISLGIGAGYRFTNVDFGSSTATYNGIGLTGRLALGYAW